MSNYTKHLFDGRINEFNHVSKPITNTKISGVRKKAALFTDQEIQESLQKITDFHKAESAKREKEESERLNRGEIVIDIVNNICFNINAQLDKHNKLLENGVIYLGVGILYNGKIGSFYIKGTTLIMTSVLSGSSNISSIEIVSVDRLGETKNIYKTVLGDIMIELDDNYCGN